MAVAQVNGMDLVLSLIRDKRKTGYDGLVGIRYGPGWERAMLDVPNGNTVNLRDRLLQLHNVKDVLLDASLNDNVKLIEVK